MELKEREGKYHNIPYYDEVEPELLEFTEGIRVLPAPYYFDKKVMFTLKKIYQPGEHKWFPKGGFELRGPANEFRAFDLDQVIVHPEIFERKKLIEKMRKRHEREDERRNKKLAKLEREYKNKNKVKGKKGRPKLSEEEKLKARLERQLNPEAKRKGRKALTDEERIRREAIKLAKKQLTGGKKGRPANPERKAQRELEEKLRRERNPERKRGRPTKKI